MKKLLTAGAIIAMLSAAAPAFAWGWGSSASSAASASSGGFFFDGFPVFQPVITQPVFTPMPPAISNINTNTNTLTQSNNQQLWFTSSINNTNTFNPINTFNPNNTNNLNNQQWQWMQPQMQSPPPMNCYYVCN